MPSFVKTLDELEQEWEACERCPLHVPRDLAHQSPIFGYGQPRGILFVGAAPTREDAKAHQLYSGEEGEIFRDLLDNQLKIPRYYLTSVVLCRACEPLLDEEGKHRMSEAYRNKPSLPLYRDAIASVPQRQACKARLDEQIYLVDPVLIVALGNEASELLLGKKVNIEQDHGVAASTFIPGATWEMDLTEKKGVWARRIGGVIQQPVTQNEVEYLVIPTFDVHYANKSRMGDRGHLSPFRLFLKDLRKAARILARYDMMVRGETPEPWTEEDDHAG